MYRAFLEGMTERQIAEELNRRGVRTDLGRAWTRGTVHQILTNEKYIGNNVYHRTSCKLKRKHVDNPPEMWIRSDGAFPAVVDPQQYALVQDAILTRTKRYSDQEMLGSLKELWQRLGQISGLLIDEQDAMPSSSAYRSRFGSLVRAYQLIGYTPSTDYSFIEINRYLRNRYPEIVQQVISRLASLGIAVERDPATDLLVLDRELSVSVVLSRCHLSETGAKRWMLRFDTGLRPDLTIAVRMDETNQEILDYYLLPALDLAEPKLRLATDNHVLFDAYRFNDLEFFFQLAERIAVEETAA